MTTGCYADVRIRLPTWRPLSPAMYHALRPVFRSVATRYPTTSASVKGGSISQMAASAISARGGVLASAAGSVMRTRVSLADLLAVAGGRVPANDSDGDALDD